MARASGRGSSDREQVLAFLSAPASYPGRPEPVVREETHGALVFLAGDEAWKIKREVAFPYMDFSTLEKRRAVCAREVEINRPLAPEIYLGCVPITRRSDGRLAFGGPGEIVEWAVHMRRFDQSSVLGNIADAKGIAPDLAKSLADAVFESHEVAVLSDTIAGAAPMRRLLAAVSQGLGKLQAFGALKVESLSALARSQLGRVGALLDERAGLGRVRRCHGDLHLGNIVLWQGRPVLFDAIEFDEAIATIDTLYDLAFLLMDLDFRGQRKAANIVLNRYLWRAGEVDIEGLKALPLFLALRAAIRAMVTAERAEQAGNRSAADVKLARRYLSAAATYLVPVEPRLVAVGGLSGTGKSTLAAALAPALGRAPGAVHLRSDLERKSLFGVGELVRLGPACYTQEASDKVYASLGAKAGKAAAAGQAVIVDAVFAKPEERAAVEKIASDLGLPFQGLWLAAAPEELLARIRARRNDASDATAEVLTAQLGWDTGALSSAWHVLRAGGSAEETLRRGSEAVGRRYPPGRRRRRPKA